MLVSDRKYLREHVRHGIMPSNSLSMLSDLAMLVSLLIVPLLYVLGLIAPCGDFLMVILHKENACLQMRRKLLCHHTV